MSILGGSIRREQPGERPSRATPRESMSSVRSSESLVIGLQGAQDLEPDELTQLKGYAGTLAEFWERQIRTTRATTRGEYAVLERESTTRVTLDNVLDQLETVEAMGISKRLIRGAELAAITEAVVNRFSR